MTNSMNGIVKEKPAAGASFRTDLPIPEVKKNDVLIEVKATAICGTDLHIMSWGDYAASRVPIPMVFGHEFAGNIVKVGEDVREYRVGDRVAGETHIPCNECIQCKTNNRHICENLKIIGVHVPGSFCNYISIPKDCVYKISDNITYKMGAMLEPMGVAVHGVSVAQVKGKDVLIYGCGPIGLMAVGAAKTWGAKKVLAADIVDRKLEAAKQMRADAAINSMSEDIRAIVLKETDGAGPDIVIDYTGSGGAVSSGLSLLKKGGTFVMVGLPNKPMTMDFSENVIYKEAAIIGVTGRRMYETWRECEEILSSGTFSLDPVVGGVYPLADFEKAFESLHNGCPGKMILIP